MSKTNKTKVERLETSSNTTGESPKGEEKNHGGLEKLQFSSRQTSTSCFVMGVTSDHIGA